MQTVKRNTVNILSTSMKFGTYVVKNIIQKFVYYGFKADGFWVNIFAQLKLAASYYLILLLLYTK